MVATVQPIEKKFIDVGEHLISYQVLGEGQPIILIHGLGTSCDSWSKNIIELSKCGKVYALDMPGFGDSSTTQEILSSKGLAKVIANWCRAMKIKKAVFVGHSFGGEICLWLSILYKKLVKSIILAASTGLSDDFSLAERFQNLIIDGFREPFFFMPKLFKAYWKAGAKRILLTIQKSRNKKLTKNLSKIKVPVLVLYGSKDPVIVYEETQEALKKIPNLTVEIIDSTHGLIFEYPEGFNKSVCRFISNLEPRGVCQFINAA